MSSSGNQFFTGTRNNAAQIPALEAGVANIASDLTVNGNETIAGSLTVTGAVVGAAVIGTGTLETSGAIVTITAAQLLGGYTYTYTDPLPAGELYLPSGADLQAALLAVGVTSAAGTRLVNPISINVLNLIPPGNSLKVFPGVGGTVFTNGVISTIGLVHITFTAADTYDAVVVLSA